MTPAHYQLLSAAEWTIWLATLAFAFWRGDRVVRLVALIHLVATGGLTAAMKLGAPLAIWAYVDAVGLPLLAYLALRDPRPWILCSAAFQLATVATHVARAFDAAIERLAYATALNTWWILELAALAWGTFEVHKLKKAAVRASGERLSAENAA